ncbi:MAG: M23 family metallopeptidase [Anaerolineae bacterium]|nr:M23 family metallopeptidase [Anaerolineae bacterium]
MAQRTFRVISAPLNIRNAPGINGTTVIGTFAVNQTFTEIGEPREVDGFRWIQHERGWSAERSLTDGRVFAELVSENAPTVPERQAQPTTTPLRRTLRVVTPFLNVRRSPSASAPIVGGLLSDERVTEVGEPYEADGFRWIQHARGWSAERRLDSTEIYAVEVKEQPPQPIPERVELPNGASFVPTELLTRLPVSLGQTQWIQYFGNTRFAYNLTTDRNPVRRRAYLYAQGLHGGIDFGNPNADIPVFAGMAGRVSAVRLNTDMYAPNFVMIVNGSYTVIYGHIANVAVSLGQTVSPDTRLATVDTAYNGANAHLHLEVRYQGQWIINPLLVMRADLRQALMNKFDNFALEFQPFEKWQTPLDQPVLQLSNSAQAVVIGPAASG